MGSTTYDDAAQKELEDELVKAGRRLHSLPSSIDEILIHLEKAESVLARVWQLPPSSTEDALYPVMKGLISDKLLRHADENVQFVVASCFSELTRITAPKFPYNDDDMREIFKLFLVALRPLSSESGSNYLRAVQILEGLATVRSNPSSNIVNYMETIMRMVIEEIDEVSLDLLRPLLASVRMDNKNISPSSWELGKTIFEGCGTKLQPYLREAVTTLNLNVDDYAPIVASLYQDTSNVENMGARRKPAPFQKMALGSHSKAQWRFPKIALGLRLANFAPLITMVTGRRALRRLHFGCRDMHDICVFLTFSAISHQVLAYPYAWLAESIRASNFACW
ncbi:UNVERIFIED_CONTAM: hypothetical protein Scaly_2743200 [Sesamum calycinum]|uniref:Uncharacterized protein n=1 Tax=Sesamum calycinum TaxID=2727403 RepID=A0AAW2J0P9_9LAMI